MLVIPVFLSQATRREGRQIGGDGVSLLQKGLKCRRATVCQGRGHCNHSCWRPGQWPRASWRWPKMGPPMPQHWGVGEYDDGILLTLSTASLANLPELDLGLRWLVLSPSSTLLLQGFFFFFFSGIVCNWRLVWAEEDWAHPSQLH